jgi:hypothetical protein
MNFSVFLPLSALALWLGAIYIDSKFSYKSPKECKIGLRTDAPLWKRMIIYHNRTVKNSALFLLWFVLISGVYLSKPSNQSDLNYVIVPLSILLIFVYALAQGWRFLVKDSESDS